MNWKSQVNNPESEIETWIWHVSQRFHSICAPSGTIPRHEIWEMIFKDSGETSYFCHQIMRSTVATKKYQSSKTIHLRHIEVLEHFLLGDKKIKKLFFFVFLQAGNFLYKIKYCESCLITRTLILKRIYLNFCNGKVCCWHKNISRGIPFENHRSESRRKVNNTKVS